MGGYQNLIIKNENGLQKKSKRGARSLARPPFRLCVATERNHFSSHKNFQPTKNNSARTWVGDFLLSAYMVGCVWLKNGIKSKSFSLEKTRAAVDKAKI